MTFNRACIAALVAFCALSSFAEQTPEERAVWKLEHSYWEYVKALDIAHYRELWHPDFVGWPSFSAEPQRKDHIADWLDAYAGKGLHLDSYSLKPAASQATGPIVVVHYWVTMEWKDAKGSGQTETVRITHTWLRGEHGWKIIGGMSMREPEKK